MGKSINPVESIKSAKPIKSVKHVNLVKHVGLTLVEIMIAVTLVAIMTTALLLLFSQGSRTYVATKMEEESIKRLKLHVPALLNEIRGAIQLINYSPLPLPIPTGSSGGSFIEFTKNIEGELYGVSLDYDLPSETVRRVIYEAPSADPNDWINPVADPAFITNVDELSFFTYSPQTVIVRYTISDGLPVPLTYDYNVNFAPKLPTAALGEEDE